MKIYKPVPKDFVRLQIIKADQPAKYITFHETTLTECIEMIQKILNEYLPQINPFCKEKRTALNFRDAKGGKNGKSTSLSFRSESTTEQIENIIIDYFVNHFE